jgi:hypothetical protein
MKKILAILSLWLPLFTFAQKEFCEEIRITHTYEDLYIRYITPLSCEDGQKNGPIVINNKFTIRKICRLLKQSVPIKEGLMPDVRFKVEFYYKGRTDILCFGQSGGGMLYLNETYKYNSNLCGYLIALIEKSGALKPQEVLPPSKYPPSKR